MPMAHGSLEDLFHALNVLEPVLNGHLDRRNELVVFAESGVKTVEIELGVPVEIDGEIFGPW